MCKCERLMSVTAKCGDLCHIRAGKCEMNSYVPNHLGIGGGDYIRFDYCLDCGKIQGSFPISQETVEQTLDSDH
jgi:hypothetical protein